ncbi:MAG: ABC transporter permease [Clostridium sp.]|nr:ABC transporter permease [Clostridium sp.]
MRISTFWYCLKQGVVNICRNILFSLASIATISACIFLFCLFFALVANVQNVAKTAETTVGITVFFEEDLPEETLLETGRIIGGWPEVKETRFISAAEAWENFKQNYFEGMEELAEGFADDNPLAGSASYEIFLKNIEDQEMVAERLQSMEGVRRVRYSSAVVAGFTSAGKMLGALSAVIIGVLLSVAVFLISNTISVAAAFRRRENEIMRFIGASGYMIRAPFVVEGVLLGAVGAAVPLAGMYFLYQEAVVYVNERYQILTGMFQPIALDVVFPYMAVAAGILGVGIGFFVSFFTIHRHLKV